MDEIFEKRARALEHLIDTQFGGKSKNFAERYDLDATRVRQIVNRHKPFGEKSARLWEGLCGLPSLYFDVADSAEAVKIVHKLNELDPDKYPEALRYLEYLASGSRK